MFANQRPGKGHEQGNGNEIWEEFLGVLGLVEKQKSDTSFLDLISAQEMSSDTAELLDGFGAHLNSNVFAEIIRRRGRFYPINRSLSDRILQVEGLSKIYVAMSLYCYDAEITMLKKSLKTLIWYDRLKGSLDNYSPETMQIIEGLIDNARERVIQILNVSMNRLMTDMGRLTLGDEY